MAGVKISELSETTTPTDGDLLVVARGTENYYIDIETLLDFATPVGTMRIFAGSSAPSGYLLCYGQEVSRTTYAGLFSTIGEAFGAGDSSTTFNLPDMRGRVPAGIDNMGGASADRVADVNADSIGGSMGEETHQLTTAEMPAHAHGGVMPRSAYYAVSGGSGTSNTNQMGNGTVATSSSAGSDGSHNNMQPTVFVNYIIKH